jgi:hypothetical protein
VNCPWDSRLERVGERFCEGKMTVPGIHFKFAALGWH